jgi:radical SAM superfamily enzyme YgiQ (UPF0313 family)
MMIDASAIAQGYSADLIAQLFEKNNCKNYMIDIGGEIVCKGVNPKGELWRIGVDKPVDDPENSNSELQTIISVSNVGLTTSGNYRQFYYKDGKKIVKNERRLPLDVNELPFPAWDLIDPHWYHDAGKRFPFLTLYSGRGCFGLCTFCRETQLMNGRQLRLRDPKKVVAEMEYDLEMYPDIKEIMFETDTFTAVPKHVEEVCKLIIKKGINKKISWSCNVRVDIRLDLLKLMKEAGCRMLMVGFEFGSQKDLDAVCCPIGVSINAQTPEEIAISIAAELIKARRS